MFAAIYNVGGYSPYVLYFLGDLCVLLHFPHPSYGYVIFYLCALYKLKCKTYNFAATLS